MYVGGKGGEEEGRRREGWEEGGMIVCDGVEAWGRRTARRAT